MRTQALIYTLGLILLISCQNKTEATFNAELQQELFDMQEADQQIRNYIANKYPDGRIQDSNDVARWDSIDTANTARLKEIIEQHGWPGKSLVGEEGAYAAFLIAQHSDRNPEFQKSVLPFLEESVKKDQAQPIHLAYLTDRVRIEEGKPQIYGTQMTWRNGEPTPFPIEDSVNVDKRRKEVGLEPLSVYIKKF